MAFTTVDKLQYLSKSFRMCWFALRAFGIYDTCGLLLYISNKNVVQCALIWKTNIHTNNSHILHSHICNSLNIEKWMNDIPNGKVIFKIFPIQIILYVCYVWNCVSDQMLDTKFDDWHFSKSSEIFNNKRQKKILLIESLRFCWPIWIERSLKLQNSHRHVYRSL